MRCQQENCPQMTYTIILVYYMKKKNEKTENSFILCLYLKTLLYNNKAVFSYKMHYGYLYL